MSEQLQIIPPTENPKPLEPEVIDPVNVGGRPSKYTPELLEKAEQYLSCYEDEDQLVPSFQGLCKFLNIGERTLYDWKADPEKERFSHTLDRIMAEQAIQLINQGLGRVFEPGITKLMLHNHGYHDKIDNAHSLSPDSALPTQYIVQPIRALDPVTPEENNGSKNDSNRDPGKADKDTG